MKILVIDDEELVLKNLQEFLLGLDGVDGVWVAPDGKQGLTAFETALDSGDGGFDLVFTDRRMPPGMFGEEVVREIKRLSPKTFVVLMSGDGREEVARIGIAAGADKIFFKPVRLESIEKAVLEAISASKG